MFKVLIILSWRNIWRNRRRSIVMLAAIIVGVWAMIFMNALMRGMVDQMIKDAVSNLTGHVQIHNALFRDDPSIQNVMHVDINQLHKKMQHHSIIAWAARLSLPGVVTSERATTGITLLGIDPQQEKGLSFAGDLPAQGINIDSADDVGIVIGKKLAEKLETKLGRRIVIMTQDPDNNIVDRGMRIVGIFDAELEATELSYAYTGLHTLQKLTHSKLGDVSEISVLTPQYRDVEETTSYLKKEFPDKEVISWKQVNKYLSTMLDITDAFILVWAVVVFFAMSFGLVNTLLMAIFERTRDIGLMQALGLTPSLIIVQVVVESVILLMIGLLIGNLLAWLTQLATQNGIDFSVASEGLEWAGMSSRIYPSTLLKDVVFSNFVVLILGIIASLYPAWRAARFVPIKALGQK